MVMTYDYRCLLPAITPHPLTPPLHGDGDPASAGRGTGGEAVCHWQETALAADEGSVCILRKDPSPLPRYIGVGAQDDTKL
jgi:hypothetical protein